MNSPLLVLDCNYLCHRAYHAHKHNANSNQWSHPIVHSFLRELCLFSQRHGSSRFVFCFDGTGSERKKEFPGYKMNRKDNEDTARVRRQVRILADTVLPALGCPNILCKEGAEADDMIACVCDQYSWREDIIIIANDSDLFQLLDNGTRMWNPIMGTFTSGQDVERLHGVPTCKWSLFKAVCGCRTDCIPGVRGVGKKGAANWINMRESGLVRTRITAARDQLELYHKLTSLPHERCRVTVRLKEHTISPGVWNKVVSDLNMHNLLDKYPE